MMDISIATLRKEFIYRIYNKTVEDPKEYESITRKKMIQEVLDYYQNEDFLEQCLSYQDILDLKEIIKNNNMTAVNEFRHLYDLLLLEYIDYNNVCINETILPFIKEHINFYDLDKAKKRDEKNNLILGMIKGYGIISVVNFKQIINIFNEMNNTHLDFDNDVLSNRVAREYYVCEDGKFSTMIVKKDLWNYSEELIEIQIEEKMNVKIFEYDSLLNIAKYGLDISVKSLKELNVKLNELNNTYKKEQLLQALEIMLNLRYEYNEIKEMLSKSFLMSRIITPDLLKLIHKAMNDMPIAIYDGMTIHEMEMKEKENIEVSEILKSAKQTTACLGPKEANQFYKMYMKVLDFVNHKYNLVKEHHLAMAFHVNPEDQAVIREKLFDDLSIIDEYIRLNPDHLNNMALKQVADVKNSILIQCVIVKYERNYTLIMSDDEELYGIIGGVCNLDEIIPADALPHMCKMALISYKDKIIYDGVILSNQVSFGSGFKKNVIESVKKGVVYRTLVRKYN